MSALGAGKVPLAGLAINRLDLTLCFDGMPSKEGFEPLVHGWLANVMRLEPGTFIRLLVKAERSHFWMPLGEGLIC